MSEIPIDPKRSGVKARLLGEFPEDPEILPGDCVRSDQGRFLFACPGCGRLGSIRVGAPKPSDRPSWCIASGSLDDPATLTLSPSIHCVGCCGWHGYLRGGVFESCD